MALKKLKQNHIIFCNKILQGVDKVEAIKEAGFSLTGARSTAHRFLKDPLIVKYLKDNNISNEIIEKNKPLNDLDNLAPPFKPGNKMAEDWDEKTALELGKGLLDWIKDGGVQNIFYNEYLIIQMDLHPNIVSYLSKKFTSFNELIEKSKKIQELKLLKFGVLDKTNAPITKFVLANNHGYSDKVESKSENSTNIVWNETKNY